MIKTLTKPGGIWGDGVDSTFPPFLSAQSLNLCSFLIACDQKLMAPHLYSSDDGCHDCDVPEAGHAELEHKAIQNSVVPSEGQAPLSKHATKKLRAALVAVRAVVALERTLHHARDRFRRTCPRPPQHEVADSSLTSQGWCLNPSLADDMPAFAPLTKPDLDGSLVLFDGMNSCAEEEHVIHDNIDGVEDSDYSASEFYEDSFDGSSGLSMTSQVAITSLVGNVCNLQLTFSLNHQRLLPRQSWKIRYRIAAQTIAPF